MQRDVVVSGYQAPKTDKYFRKLGQKMYELSNHLGNVNAVISDVRIGVDGYTLSGGSYTTMTPDGLADYYRPKVVSATDYYPFGWTLPNRSFNSGDYRFGFNGMERDNEVKGQGNSYDFGARIYDSRLGRWLSIDPLYHKFPDQSPFQFGSNSPISIIDPDGKAEYYYTLTFDNDGNACLTLTDEVHSAVWDKVTSVHVSVPDLGVVYSFTPFGGMREVPRSSALAAGSGTGNSINYWDEFKQDPLGAINSGQFVTDGEIVENLGRDIIVTFLLTRAMKGSANNNISSGSGLSKEGDKLITNKQGTHVSDDGRLKGQIVNGKVVMDGNTLAAGRFDFVVLKDGSVKLGHRHSWLAKGESVLAAGTMKIRNGKVVGFDNASGHYLPTPEEARTFINVLKKHGVNIDAATLTIYGETGKFEQIPPSKQPSE